MEEKDKRTTPENQRLQGSCSSGGSVAHLP